MPQTVSCPQCEKSIGLPDGAGGKKLKCGDCGSVSRVEESAEGRLRLAEVAPQAGQPKAEKPLAAPKRREESRRHTVITRSVESASVSAPSRRAMRRSRPQVPGVLVTSAALLIITGGLQVLGGVLLLLGTALVAGSASGEIEAEGVATAGIYGIAGVLVLAFGLAGMFCGFGILKGSRLARNVAAPVLVVGIIFGLFDLAEEPGSAMAIVILGLQVFAIIALFLPDSRAYFARAETAGDLTQQRRSRRAARTRRT